MKTNLIREKISFGLYDFSNSGYVLIFQSFLFPLYLGTLAADDINVKWYWGLAIFLSNLIAAIISPFIGKIADRKNRLSIFFCLVLLTAIGTFLTGFNLTFFSLILLFTMFNFFFELSQSIYDSFLNVIANNKSEKIEISTFAWGFGYLGGALIAIIYLILDKLEIREVYILSISSVIYFLISLLGIFMLKKYHSSKTNAIPEISYPRISYRELFRINIPTHILKLLFIYALIFITVSAIVYFSNILAVEELGIDKNKVGALILIAQLIAFPITILAGKLAHRKSISIVIKYSLFIWLLIIVGLILAQNFVHLAIVMVCFSLVIGTTQSLIRAHYSNSILTDRPSEMFGYFAIASKIGAITSPLLMSLGILIFGSIKLSFSIIAILLIVGIIFSNNLTKNESPT